MCKRKPLIQHVRLIRGEHKNEWIGMKLKMTQSMQRTNLTLAYSFNMWTDNSCFFTLRFLSGQTSGAPSSTAVY